MSKKWRDIRRKSKPECVCTQTIVWQGIELHCHECPCNETPTFKILDQEGNPIMPRETSDTPTRDPVVDMPEKSPKTIFHGNIEMTAFEFPEEWRMYHYPDGSSLKIENVSHLHVKKSGAGHSHRLLTKYGISWYVPSGWIGISSDHEGWTL